MLTQNRYSLTALIALTTFLVAAPVTGHAERLAGSVESTGSAAHPFVQTIVDAFVSKTRLTIRISSSADELDLIHDIVPDDAGKYDTEELREGVAIHAEFLLERFEIYDAAGNKLKGKLVETLPWEIPDEGFSSGELVEHMLNYTFEYEFEAPPEFLTFQNNIIDYNFSLPSEVKLLVKQAGSDVPYSALLKIKQPENVRFDWEKPLKKVMTGDELKAWFNETREKTLGITDVGGTYAFIYITPREVRHEVLMPLASLLEFVDFPREDKYKLSVKEQDASIPNLEALFSKHNPVSFNGEVVPPRFDRIDFADLKTKDFGKKKDRKPISLANGRVGVIMSFPRRNLPDELTVTWDQFGLTLRDVDVVLVEPGDKVSKHQFSKYLQDNTLSWTNPGIPPLPEVVDVEIAKEDLQGRPPLWFVGAALVLLLVCFALVLEDKTKGLVSLVLLLAALGGLASVALSWPPQIKEADAKPIFTSLHTNLFRAFDYNVEGDVYDALARTIDGPLLQTMYLDMRRSLEVKEQGGAVANIERIEIMDGELSEETAGGTPIAQPGFAFRCNWELEGTVEHWGHIHRRTNKYEALFNVQSFETKKPVLDEAKIEERIGVEQAGKVLAAFQSGQYKIMGENVSVDSVELMPDEFELIDSNVWKITEFQPIDEQQGPVIRKIREF